MSTPPRSPATYKDIQRLTGLSLATISKHFNGRNVLAQNREAILAAVNELDYRPNAFASGLRRGVSRTVGILLPSFQVGIHLSIVVGIEKFLRAEGIGVLVTSNDHDGESPDNDAVDLLLGRRVDGIISVPAASDSSALTHAVSAGVPVVTVDRRLPALDADCVCLDNERAGRAAAQHLIDHGHDRLAAVVGEAGVSSLRGREDGFLAATTAAGIEVPSDLLRRSPLTLEGGYLAMTSLLENDHRPTAVFTANHELTTGAVIAVNESGLRLGTDISVVGFDATELSQALRPRLTVYVQPVEEIAAEAAAIMRDRLNDPATPRSRVLREIPGRLHVGGSVASLRG